jgi:hypothetical protein
LEDGDHFCELIARPRVGLGHVGRTGQARADAVRQAAGVIHHVGMLEAFVADRVVHSEVERFGGGLVHLRFGPAGGWFRGFGRLLIVFVFVVREGFSGSDE